MRKTLWRVALCTILPIIGPAHAQVGGPSNDTFKAQDLYVACNLPADPNSTDDAAGLICQTYIRGLTDGLFLMKVFSDAGKAGCLPPDGAISVAEGRAEFEAFFLKHSEMATNSAGVVAALAIVQAHPC